MFNNKKGRMVRHPYLTMAVLGLATAGAISISKKLKGFFRDKNCHMGSMVKGMRAEQ